MKFAKYMAVLVLGLCAFASNSHAQTKFVGGGSSAIALEIGQAAATSPLTNTPCVWTQGKNAAIVARDNRSAATIPFDAQGQIFVTWSAGAGTCAAPANPGVTIYSYMNLDSVIGDRCYFINDGSGTTGCVQVMTIAANTLGQSLLPGVTDTAGGIPAFIIAALNGTHYNYIGTDVRPEDAKFASLRMFTSCGTAVFRQPFDLGLKENDWVWATKPQPPVWVCRFRALSAQPPFLYSISTLPGTIRSLAFLCLLTPSTRLVHSL